MTQFKTLLITAALIAAPSAAFAQDVKDMATDAAKDKAVETVMDNMTTEDGLVAAETMIKGGSKEDAAIAVVKNRADGEIESITGGVSVDEYSKDGVMDAGKEMAMQKATGSSTTYTEGSATTYTDGVPAAGGLEAGKAMALEQAREKARLMSIEKAKENAATYGMSERDKAKRKLTAGQPSGDAYVIQKSGTTMSAPVPVRSTPMPTQTQTQTQTETTPAPAVSTLNCPAGTKDAGDGTCMITGDWKP